MKTNYERMVSFFLKTYPASSRDYAERAVKGALERYPEIVDYNQAPPKKMTENLRRFIRGMMTTLSIQDSHRRPMEVARG